MKAPVAAAAPARPGFMADRMRALLAEHAGFALKFSIVVWTVIVRAAVFFMLQA